MGLRIGWTLTGVWIAVVLIATGADPSRRLFDYIFAVPLLGWMAGFAVTRVLDSFSKRKTP